MYKKISGHMAVTPMGAATMKLEASHKNTRMYWNLSLEGGICLISMEMCVRVGAFMSMTLLFIGQSNLL